MAYEAPITISKAITNIQKKKYVLPAIQREFVWDNNQIEMLFDSLMRDYPIGTFLFWKVERENISDFQFYEFLNNYHEKTGRHNPKADLPSDEGVIALLDGQQRLTSLYVGLHGTYAKKIPYYRWDSPHAFPSKKLYLNLLSHSDDIEKEYQFKFLSEDEIKSAENTHFWFEVGSILSFEDISKVMEHLMLNGLMDTSVYSKEQSSFALKTLNELYNVVHQKGIISYYLEESVELDKVLQIFIRINSGGTKLSYSDLLLSIATAQWQEKDAREVIHQFVDEINILGDGFSFNKDFVLKACLVLGDFVDIKFKVDNFTKNNMKKIEDLWVEISNAIRNAVKLVSKFGFNRDNLPTTTALIPIAYYLYKINADENFLHSSSRSDDRKAINEWLIRVILKGTFGGQPDSIYPVMRNVINKYPNRFPIMEVIENFKGKRKSISFTSDDIDNILELEYGKPRTYCALSLLYPGLNFNFKYHQDHIHPKSFFTNVKLKKEGIDENKREEYYSIFNKIANLQLLQATENIEKSNTHFVDWIDNKYNEEGEKNNFLKQHNIPSTVSLDLTDFIEFYDIRKDSIRKKLMSKLGVASETMVEA